MCEQVSCAIQISLTCDMIYLCVDRSLLYVDRSLLSVNRSLLRVDRSLLCVNRFHVRYKSLFRATQFIHKRPFHSQKNLSAVPIRIPNRNRNRVLTQCVTLVTVKKCHDFECVTSVTLSDFF